MHVNGMARFRWLLVCGVACVSLVARWPAPAMARAASAAGVPVGVERSCMGGAIGTYRGATYLPAQAQESGAQVSLDRVEGPPGIRLALSGSGWPAGASVTIDLIGRQANGQSFVGVAGIAHATAADDGSFQSGTFPAPFQHSCIGNGYGEPNSVVQFVAHTADNAVKAGAQFRYLPAPDLQILSTGDNGQNVTPGTPLAITGLHWEPGTVVMLTAATLAHPDMPPDSENVPVPRDQDTVHALADAAGSFAVTMRMPANLAPRTGYEIMAAGSGPRFGALTAFGRRFVALPAAMPTLTLDQSEGTAGSSVQMSGAHWIAGDVVQLEYCRGETYMSASELRCDPFATQGLGEARVGHDGRFEARVRLPAAARLGVVTIQARVVNDIFGLMVYAQAQMFTIVAPAVPWTTEHPLLTRVAVIAGLSVLFACIAALYVWLRLRARGKREALDVE